MPRTVFVERELTARRGRKKATVRLRFFTPVPDPRGDWSCAFELSVDGAPLQAVPRTYGVDGLQALLIAISLAVFMLERFENDSGMHVEDWAWLDVWKLRPWVTGMKGASRRAALVRGMERGMAEDVRSAKRKAGRRRGSSVRRSSRAW